MKAIVFNIKTKQPVLVTSFQGDPNSDVSYGYIPGSVIRGALIGRYLKQNSISRNADIVSDASIRSLFFDNTTRYLNAYLYDEQHRQRTLPSPLSWHKDKRSNLSEGIEIYDFSQQSIAGLDADISPQKITEPFCSVLDNNVWLFREERRVNVHNQRDRRKGRAMEGRGRGEVFRYDALEVGQCFQALILCDRLEDAEVIRNLLKQKDVKPDKPLALWLGGSQTAGYGHCEIQAPVVKESWTEIGTAVEDRYDRDFLTVHLLSDLLLRDVNGQYMVAPPNKLLEEALGVELKLQNSFLASHYVGGFNRKWGLPLPQVQVTAAGSVFVYESTGQIKTEVLKELEEKGIGDRCIDGFGRIAFNWLDESETFYALKQKPRQRAISSSFILEEATSIKLANDMATRLLRQKLDGYLLQEVNRYPISSPPTNSQLSRIMLTAQRALMQVQQEPPDEGEDERLQISRQLITQLLDDLPGNAKRQLEKAKISSSPLSQTLKAWLENPDSWLTHPPNVEIAKVKPEIAPLLKQEYTLRLIMAVAKKAMKEKPDD